MSRGSLLARISMHIVDMFVISRSRPLSYTKFKGGFRVLQDTLRWDAAAYDETIHSKAPSENAGRSFERSVACTVVRPMPREAN